MNSVFSKSRWQVVLAAMAAVGLSLNLQPCQAQEEEEVVIVVGDQGENVFFVDDEEGEKDDETEVPKLWMGIMLKPIEGDLARYLGTEEGILIDKVMDDSPAEEAGLQEGDVLVVVDGEEVGEPSDLLAIMSQIEEGDKLKLKVNRQGKKMELRLVPALRPQRLSVELSADVLEDLPEGVQNREEIVRLLEQMRARGGEKMNVFSFGGPAFQWSTDDGGEVSGEMNVTVQRDVNGEKMEIQIQRSDDGPATVTVTSDGETKEYTEEDMDELPEEVAEMVEKLMKKGKGSFRIQSLRGMPQQFRLGDGNVRVEVIKDIADQFRDQVIKIKTEDGSEMEALLETVEALKDEIEQLKAKLDEK